jgi:vancomycin permeability regulator SanA
MRGFFKLIFQLFGAALIIFLFTAALVVVDGVTDLGEKADVALVVGHSQDNAGEHLLDRMVKLFNDGDVQLVIVSGSAPGIEEAPAGMAKYLVSHGIPSSAIIVDHKGNTDPAAAHDTAEIMKSHHFLSVMIVADYYRMTRMKLALKYEGITEVDKAHVGTFQKKDALEVGHEVVALYDYVAREYLLPAAEKVKEEAQVGMDKAKTDAAKAKARVNKGFDTLPQ